MRDLGSLLMKGFRGPARNAAPVPYVGSGTGMGGGASGGDAQAAYDAHGAVGTLFAIVHQTSIAVSTTPWHLYRQSLQRDKKRRKEVPSHGFLDVWNRPNPFYTGDEFREVVQMHLDLVGEGIFVLNKMGNIIVEMWPVRPDRMQPVKHPTEFLTGWIYHGPGGEKVPLELDQVVQLKYPNPDDPYRGRGPVQTVLADIDSSRYSAEWNRNFFVNGARPGGIIEVDHRMGDDEFEQFVSRWRSQHQGTANAHRVAVLENAKWVETNFNMTDMQFLELRNLPRELIREAFAFPKPMLGTVDDVNRANAEAGKEVMAESLTVPRLRRWKSVINTFLLPQFANGKALELDFDDPTPINHEAEDRARNSQATSAATLVKAGYHADDVTDAMGLPRMRWVGIPGSSNAPVSDENEGREDAASARFA
jgi:HK97 family phage portal protein